MKRGVIPDSMDQSDLRDELEGLHPASFGWALWCCDHRQEEAEEVLQTAYLKALEGRARFDGRSTVRTWIFAVIRRTAWEQRRRRRLRERVLTGWLKHEPAGIVAPDPTDPEETFGQSEAAALLRGAVARLSTRQREVLHLVFYQDLTVEEASKVMRVSLGTARTHFERGKAQLRQILAEQQEVAHAKQ
jgi:RNA polymerase sigma-70 factor (ECF subfamily)